LIKKELDLSWYIASASIILSLLASFRQKIYIEDFAPYVVIVVPSVIKIFLHSYRIRLKEFRTNYNIVATLTILFLSINVLFLFVNKPIYLFLSNPERHFIYQYHFVKEVANELKNRGINSIICDDKTLALRLKFYGIKESNKYFLSTNEFYNYNEKISVDYYNRELFVVYIKKLL